MKENIKNHQQKFKRLNKARRSGCICIHGNLNTCSGICMHSMGFVKLKQKIRQKNKYRKEEHRRNTGLCHIWLKHYNGKPRRTNDSKQIIPSSSSKMTYAEVVRLPVHAKGDQTKTTFDIKANIACKILRFDYWSPLKLENNSSWANIACKILRYDCGSPINIENNLYQAKIACKILRCDYGSSINLENNLYRANIACKILRCEYGSSINIENNLYHANIACKKMRCDYGSSINLENNLYWGYIAYGILRCDYQSIQIILGNIVLRCM
ncbi:maa [Mytilus edulis]|uniref:Maa n=1 Tax=Mytilus edulis TaxID=6550 RepID=A0A8S3R5R6_MYTED|nr:maa [Mytilus edulis]